VFLDLKPAARGIRDGTSISFIIDLGMVYDSVKYISMQQINS
jgi:hypothetical protein